MINLTENFTIMYKVCAINYSSESMYLEEKNKNWQSIQKFHKNWKRLLLLNYIASKELIKHSFNNKLRNATPYITISYVMKFSITKLLNKAEITKMLDINLIANRFPIIRITHNGCSV